MSHRAYLRALFDLNTAKNEQKTPLLAYFERLISRLCRGGWRRAGREPAPLAERLPIISVAEGSEGVGAGGFPGREETGG